MKKIKLLSFLLLSLFIVPFVTSCGDDDENDNDNVTDSELINKAIGTWMCTQSKDEQQGQSYDGLMVGKEITINNNGTYTSTAQSFGYTGTYSVSGNIITARSNNGSTFVISTSIKGDKMTWDGTASNGVTFKYVFQRESNNQSSVLSFTKELIVGNETYNSWSVKSFRIERGSNNNIEKEKVIRFKENGSCEVFHSMETAWRITNGTLETFCIETNEPMFVYTLLSQNDDEIQVRMNGTLDDDFQATLTLNKILSVFPDNVVIEEKVDTIAVFTGCYAACASFVNQKIKLEGIRTDLNTVHNITPNSDEIYSTFQAAYRTINNVNYFIAHINTNERANGGSHYYAEARGLRAFIYYNLAMLWGDVPLVTEPIISIEDAQKPHPQSKQSEVYNYVYHEICEVLNNLPEVDGDDNSKLHFNKDAGRMLKAELEMTLGNSQAARSTLGQINKSQYGTQTRATLTSLERPVIWAVNLTEEMVYIPVYSFTHSQLFLYELTGSKEGLDLMITEVSLGNSRSSENTTDNIVSEWQRQPYVEFGYWAALKRMGKAQSVTGCYDYELLMPFYSSDIAMNPYMKQNPGY